MKSIFKELAKHINESPSYSEVQKLILEWKSQLEKFMTCDTEILRCIASTYKQDNRLKS